MNTTLFFISSGLFLGWSLGANDAANLFGTAVGSKIVKFKTAAIIMTIFITLGAVLSGAGASHTLGKLGTITKIPGAFIVALASAITVTLMTRQGLPVSTSQSIVGAIVGWNLFSSNPTSIKTLSTIVSTWILCPIISGLISIILYKIFKFLTKNLKTNLFKRYLYIKIGLILIGSFGSYSLGSNNIANVMGVFTSAISIDTIDVLFFSLNKTQILFFLGAIAISVGVITYSKNVMETIGDSLLKVSPATALIVVLSSSLVLFLFASSSLKNFLMSNGLPSFPLVPVSSSQAVVGALIGIGIAKGATNINFKKLQRISFGWILTPISSLTISYISLFFMQNVFQQNVF